MVYLHYLNNIFTQYMSFQLDLGQSLSKNDEDKFKFNSCIYWRFSKNNV